MAQLLIQSHSEIVQPGWLFRRWTTTQLYGDYNEHLYSCGSTDIMESDQGLEPFFFMATNFFPWNDMSHQIEKRWNKNKIVSSKYPKRWSWWIVATYPDYETLPSSSRPAPPILINYYWNWDPIQLNSHGCIAHFSQCHHGTWKWNPFWRGDSGFWQASSGETF